MNDRTLVKMSAEERWIVFRTITRTQRSVSFYIARDRLADLDRHKEITVHDGNSFAVFCWDTDTGILTIRFVWLSGGPRMTGREEIIRIPYVDLFNFTAASTQENGPKTWKGLSIEQEKPRPQFIFCNARRLRECLSRKDVRRKLLRFLENNFQWPGNVKIYFYGDSIPYSFSFREVRNGMPRIAGALILQGQDNMDTAYYSMHT